MSDDTPVPAGTDASAWKDQLSQPWKVELSPGRPIWCHTPPFLELMAAGQIGGELERFVLYEPFDGEEYKVVRGEAKRKGDAELSAEMAERWKNKLRVAARAMDWPRLRLKGTPNYEKGEVGPHDLTPAEVNEVAFLATRRALPPLPAMFPEPAVGSVDGVEPGADTRAGDAVSHPSEPVDRVDQPGPGEPMVVDAV